MDDVFFLVFVQCVARRALSGFCACFVPVDLCSCWGVVILLAVSFVDLFLFVLFFWFLLLLCFSVCLLCYSSSLLFRLFAFLVRWGSFGICRGVHRVTDLEKIPVRISKMKLRHHCQ